MNVYIKSIIINKMYFNRNDYDPIDHIQESILSLVNNVKQMSFYYHFFLLSKFCYLSLLSGLYLGDFRSLFSGLYLHSWDDRIEWVLPNILESSFWVKFKLLQLIYCLGLENLWSADISYSLDLSKPSILSTEFF